MRPGSRRGKRSKQASAVSEDQVRLSGRARSPREMESEEPAEALVEPEGQDKAAKKDDATHTADDEESNAGSVNPGVEITIDAPSSIDEKDEDDEKEEATATTATTNNTAEAKLLETQRTPPPSTPPRPMVDPLTPIESPAGKKLQEPSEHGSVRGDEEDADSSSPLTERSLASDALVAPKSLLPEPLIKKAIQTAEKTADAENLPKLNVERSSPAPSVDAPAQQNGQLSDSSSLSELDDDDSEAETERLDTSSQRTPRKKNATLVIRSAASSPTSTVEPDATEAPKSPKKPIADDEDANEEEAEEADDEEADAEAKTTEPTTPDEFIREASTGLAGKKRKRSFGDSGENDRNAAETAAKDIDADAASVAKEEDADGDTAMRDEDFHSENGEEDADQETAVENGVRDTSRSPSVKEEEKSMKSVTPKPRPGRKNKKSRTIEESSNGDDDPGEDSLETTNNAAEEVDEDKADNETEAGGDDNDHDNSRDEDAADAEAIRIKKAAAEDMTSIELIFAQLRDKLVEERVGEIDREIAMINDGTHPELILMSRAIQERRDQKLRVADTLIKFQKEANERETIALKAHVHAQYFQTVRKIREDILSEANEMWYAIHRERRQAEMNNNEFVYKVPRQTSTQYKHRAAYNSEVSLLAGIAKYVGFPAAPGISGTNVEDTRSDLEAMGLSSRIPQLIPQQQPVQYAANQPASQLNRPQVPQQQAHQMQQAHIAPIHQHILQQQQQQQQPIPPMPTAGTRLVPQPPPPPQAPTLQNQHVTVSAAGPAASSHANQKTVSTTKRNEENSKRPKTPVSPLIAPHPVPPPIRQYVYQSTQSPEQTRTGPANKQGDAEYEGNRKHQTTASRGSGGGQIAPPPPNFVQQPQPQQPSSSMHLASLLQDPIKMGSSSAAAQPISHPHFNTHSPLPNRLHSADSRNHAQQQAQQHPLPPLMKHGPGSPPPPQQQQHQQQRDMREPLSIHGRHSPPAGEEKMRARLFAHDVGLDRRVKEEITPVGQRFGAALGRPGYA